jgi:hypothetical protein
VITLSVPKEAPSGSSFTQKKGPTLLQRLGLV